MPLFDFKCVGCGHVFEKIVPTPIANLDCPQCGADAERQISIPAPAQFKGTGFYATDYKGK